MFFSFLKLTFRNLYRNATYSFITIVGLAVGMAASIIIMLFVWHELSFDRFHENAGRIYRVVLEENADGTKEFHTAVSDAIANGLEGTFPEIQDIVVTFPYQSEKEIQVDGKYFLEDGLIEAGPSFFDIFGYNVVKGDLHSALSEPGSAVLTVSAAQKYFRDQNPLGKILVYEKLVIKGGVGFYQENSFNIAAVVEDPPDNTHLPFNVVTHYERSNETVWNSSTHGGATYIILHKNSNVETLTSKFPQFVSSYAIRQEIGVVDGRYAEQEPEKASEGMYALHLQPLTEIHTNPQFRQAGVSNTLFSVYLFSAIGILILLVGCINYMNLTTAQAVGRIREIGVRKTIGSGKLQIAFQFIGESIISSLVALGIALFIVELFLPSFNAVFGKQLELNIFGQPEQLLFCLGVTLAAALAGGIYPAIIFSSYNASNVLRAGLPGQPASKNTRNFLVVFQFAVSVALILSTTVIQRQMNMVQNSRANIGDDKIVIVETFDAEIFQHYDAFSSDLTSYANVVDVTYCPMPEQYSSLAVIYDSLDNMVWIHEVEVGKNYFEFFGIEPETGQSFLEYAPDRIPTDAVILTEKAANLTGIKNPVGQHLRRSENTIIGVLSDYAVQPLYQETEPAMFWVDPVENTSDKQIILVRLRGENVQEGIQQIEKVWSRFLPDQPPSLSFFDDELNQAYLADFQMETIIHWFTYLAIFIAALGLFGLARYTTERRTKEIGVRKVVGASVGQIVTLLNREFFFLVIISNIVAWPVSWYVMNRWLQNFAYRIDLTMMPFFISGIVALIIAMVTVSWQTVRSARANPVESLRYE